MTAPTPCPARSSSCAPTESPLYKVLGAAGESIRGGELQWWLPHDGEPGDWHEVAGPLVLCDRGLHCTREPARWYQSGARVFECEAEDGTYDDCEHKGVYRRVRLLRELDAAALLAVQIATYGEHEIRDGYWKASGSATVWASGSATVVASGSATVVASGSATVVASGSATVWASGSATVVASGSATVVASDSATVVAFSTSTIIAHWGSATVALHDRAVFVDHRGGQTIVRQAVAPAAATGEVSP